MPTEVPRAILEVHYEAYAQEYLRKLKPEHFMEATAQATQREIFLASLALVRAKRPEVQYFNELLVQYPIEGRRKPGQVVPDNMVAVCAEPLKVSGHFTLQLQPVAPLWVLEYVSNSNKRKDYVQNMDKWEGQIKVPYYLLFYPDNQELSLFHHNGEKYTSVLPDENSLHALPELEMAVALVEGWVRFWFRGEMLPLPGQLQRDLIQSRQESDQQRQRAEIERQRVDQAVVDRQAMADQLAILQAELAALRGSSVH